MSQTSPVCAYVTYSKRQIQTETHHPLTLALFNIWRRLQAGTKPVYSQALRGLPSATTELRVDDVAVLLITYHKVYIVVSEVRSDMLPDLRSTTFHLKGRIYAYEYWLVINRKELGGYNWKNHPSRGPRSNL